MKTSQKAVPTVVEQVAEIQMKRILFWRWFWRGTNEIASMLGVFILVVAVFFALMWVGGKGGDTINAMFNDHSKLASLAQDHERFKYEFQWHNANEEWLLMVATNDLSKVICARLDALEHPITATNIQIQPQQMWLTNYSMIGTNNSVWFSCITNTFEPVVISNCCISSHPALVE